MNSGIGSAYCGCGIPDGATRRVTLLVDANTFDILLHYHDSSNRNAGFIL